ncbi:ABC transporter ATP-binding protein [Streptococcus chenjunshii]|uniref:ABC transporter ATP-binding protein n=1 Tax=Streptococcus chenjunshii TaxID=2173853 RepID=A0A372KK23_9STRE|nr:ABC transporter ATP-binding protein [Streptococcus chenjunshii]AXQ78131.1 ABC transporter ATP-binding protein [Streptococcus chenjunshii]RFU50169.1 ABC transporter ATP-binding protein [Streptococcus chenjunshii]RFU52346.1 ABC transporter ATP-binding protein [Streptococcus chenjunshii]
MTGRYAMEIDGLYKYYGKYKGVSDVSFKVKKGEIFGFLGANGSGKSTTIRCLLGLIHPGKGKIRLLDGRYPKLKDALQHIGYMPSESMFYPQMRVKETIAFAAKSYRKDCSAESSRLCRILDLPLDKKIAELSLGNRKKVGIVCALQHQPELLILDEPTSGLDPLMQERFWMLIKEACHAGASCFLSSHILEDIRTYCDRMAIIKDGDILKVGTLSDLIGSQPKKITFWKDGQLEFRSYAGSGGDLLAYLQDLQADDFLVEEPSLADLFRHYYQEEKNGFTDA